MKEPYRLNPVVPPLLSLIAVIVLGAIYGLTGIGRETFGLAVGALILYGGMFLFFGSVAVIIWVYQKNRKRKPEDDPIAQMRNVKHSPSDYFSGPVVRRKRRRKSVRS